MHLIVSFAAAASDGGRAALQDLPLSGLAAVLADLGPPRLDDGDELSLSPPHERLLARAWGLGEVADGLMPLAAEEARRLGLPRSDDDGWACITLAHWRLGTEQVSLLDPAALELAPHECEAFRAAVGELITSEGYELHACRPGHWLCRHDELADLPLASLDRVIGRNVDRWLEADPRARRIRRLQNEVQMLLHGHALNEAREARGALAVNSIWWSGTGRWPATHRAPVPGVRLDEALRSSALQEDWVAWAQAWDGLQQGALARWARDHGDDPRASLSLCGERAALTWHGGRVPAARRWWTRLSGGRRDPRDLLAAI